MTTSDPPRPAPGAPGPAPAAPQPRGEGLWGGLHPHSCPAEALLAQSQAASPVTAVCRSGADTSKKSPGAWGRRLLPGPMARAGGELLFKVLPKRWIAPNHPSADVCVRPASISTDLSKSVRARDFSAASDDDFLADC